MPEYCWILLNASGHAWKCLNKLLWLCQTKQRLNVDSTFIYVEITSRRRSTWYPRWFNVDLSTLIHRSNSTLKQRWFWVDSKTQFCSYIPMLEKLKLYIKVEKITVFQRRNNVSLSTLNQRRNLTLKQRWFWVDSKNNFVLISSCLKN